MKRSALLLAALCLLACVEPTPDPDTPDVPDDPVVEVPAFARGADVSWVSEMEHDGKTFRKQDGTPADIFDVLKDVGINSVRLRVWVNPTGGWSGKEDVLALAKRAWDAGLALMIDFHYSDFFADPARQDFPKDWAADKSDVAKTAAHVREHTLDILNGLKAAGIAPAWIQIGNETRNGFLWPLGQLWASGGSTPGGWSNFVQLYNSGYNAAKEVFPKAIVMPHLNNACDDNDWWFKDFKAGGGKMDAIALSHYPQTDSKRTPEQMNTAAVSRIRALAATYGVPVIVSEVGVKSGTESASATVLQEFMDAVRGVSGCNGVFYWEPEVYGWWKPAVYNSLGWGAYDMGAFTSDGRPSSIMNAFKQ
ncbi:MAG: glycosyl hydrolase 53 family protein [Bacteroidales bacterium]|nr:glycosyl hydrolase 53 family protein [Bacteroidales bacterium]